MAPAGFSERGQISYERSARGAVLGEISPVLLAAPVAPGRREQQRRRQREQLCVWGGMAGDSKVYTLEEVSKHNVTKDCWLIIKGKVYDVTEFMDDHPGGDEVLVTATGKDATDDFEDVGHSNAAREQMEKYYVGELDAPTVPSKQSDTPLQQPPYSPDKNTDFVTRILQFLVPLLILGLAFVVRHYTKME